MTNDEAMLAVPFRCDGCRGAFVIRHSSIFAYSPDRMSSTASPAVPPLTFGDACARFGRWCREQPAQAALLAACLGTFVYFYFCHRVWVLGAQTTAEWAQKAWMFAGGEQMHGHFPPFVSLFLVWYHRARIAAAPKGGAWWGLVPVVFAVLLFVIGARCLQPRMALLALPFLFYGATLFLWGRHVARIVLFPCVFLLFMIPVAALQQATFHLQFVITASIELLAKLIGISIHAVGTTLTARDGSFNFEIAEGCSGVRSLAAMSMLTAVYVHLTQDAFWKKALIFAASLLFAIVGNIGRLFTVILFAKFISPEIAGGIYHDYSGFVFFPVALLAMTGFAGLVNLDWQRVAAAAMKRETPRPIETAPPAAKSASKPGGPISYDY
jgi:exosortase